MGACATKTISSDKTMAKPEAASVSADKTTTGNDNENTTETSVQEFELKKRRPGCTGMFWRSDPTGTTGLASNANWPRDGAKLRGQVVVTSNGEKWLLATSVLQKGSTQWKAAPQGAAMPFEYNNHYYLE
mmetsp:Transcript_21925/g.40908  ORF Transcript_21925/g.40908 Transcript_21925/m.40908 type:complete len:130 (-) Transcript_21925:98-487(-)